MRKTKIICTLGPSTDNKEVLKRLVEEGMDVARFNFSHGSYEEHGGRFELLEKIRKETGKHVAALLDTKGPEIRLKEFKDGKVHLDKGQLFTLTTQDVEGTKDKVSITYKDLPKDLEIGARVLIDDGLIGMVAKEITETDIVCEVLNDGFVSNKKGVNVPDTFLSMPYVSSKDRADIVFGIEKGYDFIAASFVRSADDVLEVRKILEQNNCNSIHIISKIENIQGVENIDEIIKVSDGIMVARGDMGVEIPLEDVPSIQKMIIKKVYKDGKQVITATQMLDSMMKNPRPTRAEATDVANAIYDGTSAIMLSGETAAGKYPVEALQTMVKIARRTEHDIDYKKRFLNQETKNLGDVTEAISHSTCMTAHDLDAKAIIGVSKSGKTVRGIAKFRPDCPILGCSTFSHVCRQMNLIWGVIPMLLEEKEDTFELFQYTVIEAKKHHYLQDGDVTVITAGLPLGKSGTTNMIKVQIVGEEY